MGDRFTIDPETRNGIPILWLIDTTSGSRAGILPAAGGTLWSVALCADNTNPVGDEYNDCAELLAGDPLSTIEANPWFRGRILFPFNDRIPHGRYQWNSETYQLRVNDHDTGDAIHGLVYDQPFQTVESRCGVDFAEVVLRCGFDRRRFTGFPFAAQLDVRYTLRRERLDVALTARNPGSRSCPVAMGIHPYVRTEPSVDTAALLCASDSWVEVDNQLLPTGNQLQSAGSPYDFEAKRSLLRRELDIALRRRRTAVAVTEVLRRGDTVVVEQETRAFAYTQLFIPPDRESIAVEPITAATNSFNDARLGLRVLRAGDEFMARCAFSRRMPPG